MTKTFPLFVIYRYVSRGLKMPPVRRTAVVWNDASGFALIDDTNDADTFEPDISDLVASAPRPRRRFIGKRQSKRLDRIIRVAFYDVRYHEAPILVLDSVGIAACKLEFTARTLFLRIVLRNALSPHARADVEDPPRGKPRTFANVDFQGPIFGGVLRHNDQKIDPENPIRTTANFERVVVSDKYFADPASPARYRPRGADAWQAPQPDETAPIDEFVPVPEPDFDPKIDLPNQEGAPSSDDPISSLSTPQRWTVGTFGGDLLRIGAQAVRYTRLVAFDEPPRESGTRVADLVGHHNEGEVPQWFSAGPFEGDVSIPVARTLGIDADLSPGTFLVPVDGELNSLDNPHWKRRMRVIFERGPALPGRPGIRTIEVSLNRAFGVVRDIHLSNTDAKTYRAHLPVALYLGKRKLNPPPPWSHGDCQNDARQYRFVQRQPPLWCVETVRVDEPIRYVLALEAVALDDVQRMWNRDVAGRYLGAVASIRNDRRISLLPSFTAKEKDLGDKVVPGHSEQGQDEPERDDPPSDPRFALLLGLADSAQMFGEPERFKSQPSAFDGLELRLWRVEPGTMRDAYDRALAYLFTETDAVRARARAGADNVIARLVRNIAQAREQNPGAEYLKPERLHFGPKTGPIVCRVGDQPRAEAGAFFDNDVVMNPRPRFLVGDKGWDDIAAFHQIEPSELSFETPLFVDSVGQPLTWKGLFDFGAEKVTGAADPADSNGQDRIDRNELRLDLSSLRAMAGVLPLLAPTGPASDRSALRPPFFSFRISRVRPRMSATARLGAYDLVFDNNLRPLDEPGLVLIWLDPIDYRDASERREYEVHTELQFSVPVRDSIPGAQDDIEGADLRRTTRPLLIVLNDETATSGTRSPLEISVLERAYHRTRQQIELQLRGESLPSATVVVLDTAPLFIAKITMDALATGGSGGNLLATWKSDLSRSPTWRVSKQADGYDLVLPSPAVGETVARDRTYGLQHDPDHRQYEELADFRLSPPLTLRLGTDPRFGDRTEVEPPFNTRRIFGTAQDRGLFGAPLFEAEFELLYGMTARVQGTRGLEMREIGTDIGRAPTSIESTVGVPRNPGFRDGRLLPNKTPVDDAQSSARRRLVFGWSRVLDALESRPAVLSIRYPGRDRVTVTNGVEFELRETADIAAPVELDQDLGDTPYNTGRPRHENVRRAIWGRKPHPPLEGGAEAGFESPNIYRELWRAPRSVSAELTEINLTALGAGGSQRGTFARGKQRIISRASQGRTHFYSLERIGRIATYWNRAKHVIIYERTTSPTAQFDQTQPTLLGRPVLRKVREYVEILQPRRSFPEDGAQAQRAGPVLALRFDATIIPVDSAWGSDVGSFGWKLPLFQPGAVGYVAPPIDFEMAVDERSGTSSRLCRCRTPERIFFYTSTLDGDGEDTDEWANVPGVDYCLEPAPKPPRFPATNAGNVDANLPGAQEVIPGFDLFTQIIDTADGPPINLGARRTEKPIVATLRNITVTRGALPTLDMTRPIAVPGGSVLLNVGSTLEEARTTIGGVRMGLDAIAETIERLSDPDITEQKIKDFLDLNKSEIVERLNESEFGEAVGNFKKLIDSNIVENPGNVLCAALDKEALRVTNKLCKAVADAQSGLRGEIDAALAVVDGPFTALKRLADRGKEAEADIRAALAQMKTVTAGFASQLANAFPGARNPLQDTLKAIPIFTRPSAQSITGPLLRAIEGLKPVGNVDVGGDVDAVEAQVRSGIAEARRVVGYAKRSLDTVSRSTPLKLLTSKDGPLTKLRTALSSADGELLQLDAKVADLFTEVRAKAKTLAAASAEAVTALEGAVEAFNEEIDTRLTAAETAFNAVVKALRRPFDPEVPVDSETYPDVPAELVEAVRGIRTPIFTISNAIDDARRKGAKLLLNLSDDLDEFGKPTDDIAVKIEDLSRDLAVIRQKILTRGNNGTYVGTDKILTAIQSQFAQWLDLENACIDEDADINASPFKQFCDDAIGNALNEYAVIAKDLLASFVNGVDVEELFDDLRDKLAKQIGNLGIDGEIDVVRDALRGAIDTAAGEVDRLAETALGPLRETLRDEFGPTDLGNVQDIADNAVRLYRAFGNPPEVPSLGFNRETLGYFFDEKEFKIDTTPVTALFDRVGNDLKGLGLRVPMTGLTERLLPDFAKDFKIGSLFPDIGGIKLDRLLEDAIVPDGAADYVDITHGIDKESRTGWIDATVKPITVSGDEPLFELFGLTVNLGEGKFSGSARQEIGLDGQQVSSGKGKIRGDWKLAFGGYDLVTFVDTPLAFDQTGKFDFGVSAERVQLAPELSFIDKFLNSNPLLGGPEQGFTVGVLQEGLIPVGVECLLDLPIPPMIYGTTGVSGLRLICGMQLRVVPEFSITVHAAIGSIETPFTITIFILGGTGWIQTWGQYIPRTGELRSSVSVAIGVSAMLGLSFGPISGSVQIVIAIKGQLITSNQARDILSVSLLIICSGQVDVAGLISASLLLIMELKFEDQGRTIYGTGTVSFRIRISRFFTYRISQSVTYRFKGSGGQSNQQSSKHVDSVV